MPVVVNHGHNSSLTAPSHYKRLECNGESSSHPEKVAQAFTLLLLQGFNAGNIDLALQVLRDGSNSPYSHSEIIEPIMLLSHIASIRADEDSRI